MQALPEPAPSVSPAKNKIASAGEPVTIGTGQNNAAAPSYDVSPKWRTTMSNYSPAGGGRRLSGWRAPFAVATLLACLLPASASLALPEDRDQPIQITADTAIRDEKQGFTVYTGNVHMIQGSLDIVADTITIFHETAQADKIVAEGKPARMQQQPAKDEPLVKANAEIIEYYKIEDRVHLKVNAQFTQDGASVTGDTIDYYITEQLVKADSAQSPDSKRVRVVIPPTLLREEKPGDGQAQSN
jgi:lipopolysaccharide export system protein LptA